MLRAAYAHRAHDFFEFASSLAVVVLALLGMGGVVYHALAPSGWLHPWLARLWTNHPGMTALVVLAVATMAVASRSKVQGRPAFHGRSDAPLYLFVALGSFFVARWILNGAM